MGFDRKAPKPTGHKVPKVTPVHTHRYYEGDTRREETCYCATGQNHTTPKPDKVVEGPDE